MDLNNFVRSLKLYHPASLLVSHVRIRNDQKITLRDPNCEFLVASTKPYRYNVEIQTVTSLLLARSPTDITSVKRSLTLSDPNCEFLVASTQPYRYNVGETVSHSQ
ncbi:hypothetical protein RRG08_066284 [Elysia crispata]|uniref:Uncharacterized protein n=1 Tax=Elysia crispata TaxID=231223 RepID=A0AAE1E2M2_9GAST|nr:hypothetical protein RRG08_066284 [Elysia crispata]